MTDKQLEQLVAKRRADMNKILPKEEKKKEPIALKRSITEQFINGSLDLKN